MQIIRNKKTYTLTQEELLRAYLEKEHEFDVKEIALRTWQFLSQEELKEFGESHEFLDKAAYLFRKYVDKYGMAFEPAFEEAIYHTKLEYLNSEESENTGFIDKND